MQFFLTAVFEFVFYAGVTFYVAQFISGLLPRYELPPVAIPDTALPDYGELFAEAEAIATQSLPQLPDPWEMPLDETVPSPQQPNIWALPTLRLLPPALEVAKQSQPEYSDLSIRQLKKLASAAKVKNYNVMTKAQLIERLSA